MNLLKFFYEECGIFSILLVSVIFIALIGSIFPQLGNIPSWGGEREGKIKYDDCREIIFLSHDALQKSYRDFICTYNKTFRGVILSSVCARVEMENSPPTCTRAYVYNYELGKYGGGCSSYSSPYLGYDDSCHSEPQ